MQNYLYILIIVFGNFSYLYAKDYKIKPSWRKAGSAYYNTDTSLVWDIKINKGTWKEAKEFCQKYTLDGKDNWTLPTINDFQTGVCKVTGYKTRVACPKPKNHNHDLWLLLDSKKNYWTIDIVPGDPYNAYYFDLSAEGQHVISSKEEKLEFVCVRKLKNDKLEKLVFVEDNFKVKEKKKKPRMRKDFSYYIQPSFNIGAFTSNDTYENEVLLFSTLDIRSGINFKEFNNKNLFITFSADIGIDIQHFEWPLISNLLFGPEYFIVDYISLYAGAGLGITRKKYPVNSTFFTETNLGFAWKISSTMDLFDWGKYVNQKNLGIVLTYTGTRTSRADMNHVFLAGISFRFFD